MRIQSKNMIKFFAALAVLLTMSVVSTMAQITEKAEFGKFAITNATIHTVSNGVINNGTVLIDGEKISFVGENVRITPDFKRVDATGKHVYPGFIDSGTFLGLDEVSLVPVTIDSRELGDLNPQVRAFTAINPSSVLIPVTRVNGVTNVIAHPRSGLIAGRATFIDLFGYSPDSMALAPNAALHVEWPSALPRNRFDRRSKKAVESGYKKNLKTLADFWSQAKFYNEMMTAYEADPKGKTRPDKNIKFDAMRDVFAGKLSVMITVNKADDILNALKWIKENEGINFILSSVAEGWRVADEIAEAGVPCLVGPTLRTPSRQYDNYQRPYQNPGLLHKAGVKVAIRTGETENTRNLLYNAGYAATYGLGTEEALKAVTINPAEIFGLADKIGSIDVGKNANLFITDGDPFETMTTVEAVFIRGYKIPMTSRHTQLFEEYYNRDVRSN